MLSTAYRILTDLGSPVINLYLRRRQARGREDSARFTERLGQASQPRPDGHLVWCHAASVGEAVSLLALIENLRANHPATHVLVTTGTVTSARMLEGRLPTAVVHQYVPVDRVPYVKRFLDHWQPDLALWIESELWPNMLAEIKKREIPAVLLNGIISEKSFRNWYRVKGWSRSILGAFALVLTQTEEDQSRFVALGAKPVRCAGNLKYAGKPLPYDEARLAELYQSFGARPKWLMASTHEGEEDMALAAHRKLRTQWPELLTIIVPRHPARGDDIALKIAESGLRFARRSRKDPIDAGTQIYLADTMGELGLFYRLSPIMCMGGSFVPVGGHNMIEPAQLGCAIICGPHMQEYSEMLREFRAREAAIQLRDAEEIPLAVGRFLSDPAARERLADAAAKLAHERRNVLEKIMDAIEPWLGPKATASVAEKKVVRL